jgi:hypothetical protein
MRNTGSDVFLIKDLWKKSLMSQKREALNAYTIAIGVWDNVIFTKLMLDFHCFPMSLKCGSWTQV